ncbi:MAG: hypothetical protein SFT68_05800 [Rickettsiaceae bacterium]|nr:hypothetical protein [Rickettsiaceae bacterium]
MINNRSDQEKAQEPTPKKKDTKSQKLSIALRRNILRRKSATKDLQKNI